MIFIGHRKRKGSNAYLFYGEWSSNDVEHPFQISGRTLAINVKLPKSPNGVKQVVKITYLPFLFIEYLEFSKMHCNLFNFEIQIILVKICYSSKWHISAYDHFPMIPSHVDTSMTTLHEKSLNVTKKTPKLEDPYLQLCNSIWPHLYTIGMISLLAKTFKKTPKYENAQKYS